MEITNEFLRIPSEKMKSEFLRILISVGFSKGKAEKCASIFLVNSLEGISSHGVNRFPRFIKYIKGGYIRPDAEPEFISGSGALEQWNGNLGPGPLNASFASERAMELASANGLGLVAMAGTNHWMRGGTYGWQAAAKGFVFLGWTNTMANMPAWGAKDHRLGNNPFVIAVPFKDEAIVLDFSMSQYSYGKIESFRNEGRQLPSFGGYNIKGNLTTDPAEILESWRALPVGLWKGAGLSLLLDITATILSGGASTHQISHGLVEFNVSQVFMAIDIRKLSNFPSIDNSIKLIIDDYMKSVPENKNTEIRYPGENVLKTREENLKNGIPVNRGIWEKILSL